MRNAIKLVSILAVLQLITFIDLLIKPIFQNYSSTHYQLFPLYGYSLIIYIFFGLLLGVLLLIVSNKEPIYRYIIASSLIFDAIVIIVMLSIVHVFTPFPCILAGTQFILLLSKTK